MIEMSVTDFAKNMHTIFERIQKSGEEVVLLRDKHRIARIVPAPQHMTAREAMSDLYRTLPEDSALTWISDSRLPGTIEDQLSDPWAS